ncbi:N-alpha-acetyltransferase 80 isoform X2 [Aplysia californica]|nr:N-alpha-acetyltransferase 80 isoform X2 [Aplysia californica]XP_035824723.1 N-alpha-acetyltransferase 80 isoform X2 [Aplysia californica]
MTFELLALHKDKHLTDACAEILNKEWPRSMAARNHSLSKSCDELPICLAFVRRSTEGKLPEVMGFSKISAVQGIQQAGLIESVIVREEDRGKGFGRTLMDLTEEHAKCLGLQTLYLNTLDKEGFYARLGYVGCQPVLSLGANAHRVPESMLRQFMASSSNSQGGLNNVNNNKQHASCDLSEKIQNISIGSDAESRTEPTSSDVPAPPQLPPPPPPPPPPPAPPSVPPSLKTKTYDKTVIRMDPNSVIWMKKTL